MLPLKGRMRNWLLLANRSEWDTLVKRIGYTGRSPMVFPCVAQPRMTSDDDASIDWVEGITQANYKQYCPYTEWPHESHLKEDKTVLGNGHYWIEIDEDDLPTGSACSAYYGESDKPMSGNYVLVRRMGTKDVT